ncbi:MAG: thioredoxin family protein [Limisphaerales bacterium]
MAMAVSCIWLQTQAADLNWGTDVPKALTEAKADKKIVLLDFTGSDWCGWCIKLNKEVFSTPEFAKYAKDNLVMVEVDFPRKKQLSAEQKAANNALQEKYKIQGYPTVIVLNGDGKKIGELGYMEGGPAAFIAELNKLKKKS